MSTRDALYRIECAYEKVVRMTDQLILIFSSFVSQLVHELLALELLTVLLSTPTDDSVEVAIAFVKECGFTLQELTPQGLHGIFERFRGILHEGEIDKRVQFMIEGLFAFRKGGFEGKKGVPEELDLVDEDDQVVHEIGLDDEMQAQAGLDVFKEDPEFEENERKYDDIRKEILGESSSSDSDSDSDSDAGRSRKRKDKKVRRELTGRLLSD